MYWKVCYNKHARLEVIESQNPWLDGPHDVAVFGPNEVNKRAAEVFAATAKKFVALAVEDRAGRTKTKLQLLDLAKRSIAVHPDCRHWFCLGDVGCAKYVEGNQEFVAANLIVCGKCKGIHIRNTITGLYASLNPPRLPSDPSPQLSTVQYGLHCLPR